MGLLMAPLSEKLQKGEPWEASLPSPIPDPTCGHVSQEDDVGNVGSPAGLQGVWPQSI